MMDFATDYQQLLRQYERDKETASQLGKGMLCISVCLLVLIGVGLARQWHWLVILCLSFFTFMAVVMSRSFFADVRSLAAPAPMPAYGNFLGLGFLSKYEVARPTSYWQYNLGEYGELWRLSESLQEFNYERKHLTEFIETRDEKEMCRKELLLLADKTKFHLAVARQKHSFVSSDGNVRVTKGQIAHEIATFERLLAHIEEQLSRVEAWKESKRPYVEQVTFETLNGDAEIARNGEDEAMVFALTLPAGAYRVVVQKDGQEVMSEESAGEGRYDFVKSGIGAVRNGQAIIEDLHTGQRERVPFW